jgi:ribosomal protein S18 acetylase RimI-like enzyme
MSRIQVETNYSLVRRKAYEGLVAYNTPFGGKIDHRPLAISVRKGKKIIGALVGQTFWGWLYIEFIWVSEELRKEGVGKSLIAKAEAEARKRGARYVYLNTFNFQAPGFYRKLGYRQFGKMKDFPRGYSRHWFMKAL